MDDIAVQFERFCLTDDIFAFKPIGVVRGKYNNSNSSFVTNYGKALFLITNADFFDEMYINYSNNMYFFLQTSISELREKFGNVTDDQLITNYFSICLDYIYICIYDSDTYSLRVKSINVDDFKSLFDEHKDDENKFIFNEEDLMELKDLSTLKEIKSHLNKLINSSKTTNIEIEVDELPKKLVLDRDTSNQLSLKSLKDNVLSKIVGQDKAVCDVTTGIMINYRSKNPKHKSHILIAGPTGTGKTAMVEEICKYLKLPYFIADATAYTKEGYVGKSVYSMLSGLIDAAGGKIEEAQNGILVIDEIDKKAGTDGGIDVAGKSVLQSLLKIMDRNIIQLNNSTNFDTSNLTVIVMGAFSDLYEKKRMSKKRGIGFAKEDNDDNSVVITKQDLIDYGMTEEFMGRIGITTYTNEFSLESLIKLLEESKFSPIVYEKEFFNDLGVKITFTSAYIREIAIMNKDSKEGARGLKNLVKASLSDVYEKVLSDSKVKSLVMTKQTAHDPKEYYVG